MMNNRLRFRPASPKGRADRERSRISAIKFIFLFFYMKMNFMAIWVLGDSRFSDVNLVFCLGKKDLCRLGLWVPPASDDSCKGKISDVRPNCFWLFRYGRP